MTRKTAIAALSPDDKNEVNIDFSQMYRFGRKRRRSQREIHRYWQSRYNKFSEAGFCEKASTWAADHGVSVRSKRAKEAMSRMKELIDFYKRHGASAERAEEMANQDLWAKIQEAEETEWIPFFILSP